MKKNFLLLYVAFFIVVFAVPAQQKKFTVKYIDTPIKIDAVLDEVKNM